MRETKSMPVSQMCYPLAMDVIFLSLQIEKLGYKMVIVSSHAIHPKQRSVLNLDLPDSSTLAINYIMGYLQLKLISYPQRQRAIY